MKKMWPIPNKILFSTISESNQNDKLTDEAVELLTTMIEHIQSKFKYTCISDKEDCRSNALLQVLLKWKHFDLNKKESCFSWFTQLIKNALYAGWKEIHKKKADFSTSAIFLDEI
jgi:DNA-directed RNA polymerase specialized sigma subunit